MKRVSGLVHGAAVFCLAFFFAATVLPASGRKDSDSIPDDPAVLHGTLDNGLTYFVRSNARPANRAQLWLVVKAGSVLENPDQSGIAHFLEHMLFNGTESYPRNELVKVLESFGIAFGADVNASTGLDTTTYRLELATDNRDQFLTGFKILEEWAFRATLSEEELEKERGVIFEEWRSGLSAQRRLSDKTFQALFRDSLYAERMVIGDMDVVMNVPVETMREFYTDWYRPNLMAVIAVGDFDADDTVSIIRDRFSSYRNPKPERPRPRITVPEHSLTYSSVLTDPEATNTHVKLYVKNKAQPLKSTRDYTRLVTDYILKGVLNQRLDTVSRTSPPPFLSGYAFSSNFNQQLEFSGLTAEVASGQAPLALQALVRELERIRRFGVTEPELDIVRRNILGSFEAYWTQRTDLESISFVQDYVNAFTEDTSFPSIDWEWEQIQQIVKDTDTRDLTIAAQRLFPDRNRVIIVDGPPSPELSKLDNTTIQSLVSEAKNSTLTAWEHRSVDGPLVPNPPAPGSIVERGIVEGTDILDWKLSNGARVLVKQTDFQTGSIEFQALSPGGLSLVDTESLPSARLASSLTEGGYGQYSTEDLKSVLAGNTASLSGYIGGTSEGLMGSTTPDDLETLLQLVFLSQQTVYEDAGFWDIILQRTRERIRNRDASPFNRYGEQVESGLYKGNPRVLPTSLEQLEQAGLDMATRIYRERMGSAGNFTYIFVGDVDPDVLAPLVEQWIGGQESGAVNETWQDTGVRLLEEGTSILVEAGSEPLSVVRQMWPGEWDGSVDQLFQIRALADALNIQLTRIVREELGATYSIGVYPRLSLAPFPEYILVVQYSCDPDRIEELTDVVKSTMDSWKSNPQDESFALDVRAAQESSFSESLEDNRSWLNRIAFSVQNQADIRKLIEREEYFRNITPEYLQQAANQFIQNSRYVEAILLPEK